MSIDQARKLRTQMTDAEKRLWYLLRDQRLAYKFRRQVPVGPYVLDFTCPAALLAIEVDGGQHCENADDLRRSEYLNGQGWHVMRFWNNEVLHQTEIVTEKIVTFLRTSLSEI